MDLVEGVKRGARSASTGRARISRRWRVGGRAAATLAWLAAAACQDLPLPPDVEPGGEPGPAIYTSVGAFERVTYPATGSATYTIDANGQAALTLSTDFSVPQVPRISIFLSNSPDLERAVRIAALEAATGAQRWTFSVPRGAVWSYAVIWSEELWVEVSRARLAPR